MAEKIKEYSKDDLTVYWKPDRCIHSEKCFKGLSSVFNPKARPWVNIDGASIDEIRKQVDTCPSGALSHNQSEETTETTVEVTKDGPLIFKNGLSVIMPDGSSFEKEGVVALCRCGASGNKPFCDGSHKREGFKS